MIVTQNVQQVYFAELDAVIAYAGTLVQRAF